MTIEEWEKDFKSFINELQMPNDDYKEIVEYISDGVALLKEQEAVEPKVSSSEQRCGNCNKVIEMDGWKSCPWCGKRIDWNGWWKKNDARNQDTRIVR